MFDCIMTHFYSLQRGVKDAFFNSKLKYTGVPLHICTDANKKCGE